MTFYIKICNFEIKNCIGIFNLIPAKYNKKLIQILFQVKNIQKVSINFTLKCGSSYQQNTAT